jgi:hypothetical protein
MLRRHFRPGGWGSVTTTDDPRRAVLGATPDPAVDAAAGALVAAVDRYAASVPARVCSSPAGTTAQLCAQLRAVVGGGSPAAQMPDGLAELRMLCRLVVQLAPHVDPSYRVPRPDVAAITFADGLATVVAAIDAAAVA